jgi:uncharacterized protein
LLECMYLHGFASGPSSTKAQFFTSRLGQLGMTIYVPDLNGQSFADITITSQLQSIENTIKGSGGDFLVIGSSMGGLLSVIAANRFPCIRALILMAPAFGMTARWQNRLGANFTDWKRREAIEIDHHAFGRKMPLKYSFIEDLGKYQTENLKVSVPTLVLHGKKDDSVPLAESEKFLELNRDFVELHIMDSDHQLADCLPELWELTGTFMKRHRLLPEIAGSGLG